MSPPGRSAFSSTSRRQLAAEGEGSPALLWRVDSFRFLPAELWRGRRSWRRIRSFRSSPRPDGVFPGVGREAVEERFGGPVLTDRAGLYSGVWCRPSLRPWSLRRAMPCRRMLRTAAIVASWRWSWSGFFDLSRRGAPARSLRGMGIFPGRRWSFLEFKTSPPAASYICGGSKSFIARCLFGTLVWCCRSSPPATVTASEFGDELWWRCARSFFRTRLLFVFYIRGFFAIVYGQLSACILPVSSLYLYLVLFVFFLTTV